VSDGKLPFLMRLENQMSVEFKVIVPTKGRHFHLFGDCAGMWQGWENSAKAGNNVWSEFKMPLNEAESIGKFACIRCFQKAGIVIPAELDRHKVTAAKRAARLALSAA
jgi:hypothetical protein